MRARGVAAAMFLGVVPVVLGTTVIACPSGQFATCAERWKQAWDVDPSVNAYWTEVANTSSRLPDDTTVIRVVEFSDYECSSCADAHREIARVSQSSRSLGLAFRHLPLPNHPLAPAAARASICADQQGRFQAMHALLFEHSEWRDGTDWQREAIAAGVPDERMFAACLQSQATSERLQADAAMGRRLGIRSLPIFVTRSGLHPNLSPPQLRQLLAVGRSGK